MQLHVLLTQFPLSQHTLPDFGELNKHRPQVSMVSFARTLVSVEGANTAVGSRCIVSVNIVSASTSDLSLSRRMAVLQLSINRWTAPAVDSITLSVNCVHNAHRNIALSVQIHVELLPCLPMVVLSSKHIMKTSPIRESVFRRDGP